MKPSHYQRIPLKYTKLYWAVLENGVPAKRRALKRIFKRAAEAENYARRVAERWNRLKEAR